MTYDHGREYAHKRAAPLLLPLALLLLSACTAETDFKSIPGTFEPKATRPSTGKPSPDEPSVTVPENKPSNLPRTAAPLTRPIPAKAILPDPKDRTRRPMPARSSPIASTSELAGRTVAEVVALLGKPEFRRKDGAAEIWRYDGAACYLHLFFYEAEGATRVRHAEIRRRSGTTLSDRACIGDAVS